MYEYGDEIRQLKEVLDAIETVIKLYDNPHMVLRISRYANTSAYKAASLSGLRIHYKASCFQDKLVVRTTARTTSLLVDLQHRDCLSAIRIIYDMRTKKPSVILVSSRMLSTAPGRYKMLKNYRFFTFLKDRFNLTLSLPDAKELCMNKSAWFVRYKKDNALHMLSDYAGSAVATLSWTPTLDSTEYVLTNVYPDTTRILNPLGTQLYSKEFKTIRLEANQRDSCYVATTKTNTANEYGALAVLN